MKSPKSSGRPKRRNLAKQFIIRQVQGDSMLPALHAGQLVIGRQTRELQPGDVVIVSHNGLEKIKRIERQQGDLIYLLGDNASASTDSRDFGWLAAKYIIAKVVWPKL
ncbi:MAG TPA: S26 family signal peptidase [Candidatus Saccharimonadales bacterium]|nr:S26 family signal peptidase [Candidatus Saccharimonadales bacterium]